MFYINQIRHTNTFVALDLGELNSACGKLLRRIWSDPKSRYSGYDNETMFLAYLALTSSEKLELLSDCTPVERNAAESVTKFHESCNRNTVSKSLIFHGYEGKAYILAFVPIHASTDAVTEHRSITGACNDTAS